MPSDKTANESCPERCECGVPCIRAQTVHELHACAVHASKKVSDEFHEGPFETIEMALKDGSIAAYGSLAPYVEYPEVVVWGSNVFKLERKASEGVRARYTEVFAVAIVSWKFKLEQEANYHGGRPFHMGVDQ